MTDPMGRTVDLPNRRFIIYIYKRKKSLDLLPAKVVKKLDVLLPEEGYGSSHGGYNLKRQAAFLKGI